MSWKPAIVLALEVLAFELGGYLHHRELVNGALAVVIFASASYLAYAAWAPTGYWTISQCYAHVRNHHVILAGTLLWLVGSALYFHLGLGLLNHVSEDITP